MDKTVVSICYIKTNESYIIIFTYGCTQDPIYTYKHMLNCAHIQVATNEMYATHKGIIEGSQSTVVIQSLLLQGLV